MARIFWQHGSKDLLSNYREYFLETPRDLNRAKPFLPGSGVLQLNRLAFCTRLQETFTVDIAYNGRHDLLRGITSVIARYNVAFD
jgi:hypothetical protein